MRFFGLALGVEEAAEDDNAVVFETGVGGEDHGLGEPGWGFDEFLLRQCVRTAS